MTERRRLAAILVADVVGYSKLIGNDEAGTLAKLLTLRSSVIEAAIAKHAGRLFKAVGDGFLVEFASAVQAVEAARAIQQANAEGGLALRIGIHVGDVVVRGDDLMGDGVNIAARIEGAADPGGIAISRQVRDQVRDRLDIELIDKGEVELKNIARPVRIFTVAGAKASVRADILPLPNKPSIAVLPFQNMSDDAEQDYFVDGLVEDIITALSRFKSLFVIARNSSFSYKGKSPAIRQVGRKLGVRYVLEGSIRRAANRIRVTGQLIDTLTGNHIWAERYDLVLEDVFAVQEEVTQAIVAAIAPQITLAERSKAVRRRPNNLSAYEIALRAWVHSGEGHDKADQTLINQSIREAREALAIDPTSVLALQSLARALGTALFLHMVPDREETLRDAELANSRALELDDENPYSYALRGLRCLQSGQHDRYPEGLADARRAHDMNPNDVDILLIVGILETTVGEPERALEHLHQVMRLDPRASRSAWTYSQLAFACFGAKQYPEGIGWALRALRDMPQMLQPHVNLACCLVGTGEIDKAKAAFEAGQRLAPEFFRVRLEGSMSPFTRPEDRKRLQMFPRIAAGLEDPSVAEALR